MPWNGILLISLNNILRIWRDFCNSFDRVLEERWWWLPLIFLSSLFLGPSDNNLLKRRFDLENLPHDKTKNMCKFRYSLFTTTTNHYNVYGQMPIFWTVKEVWIITYLLFCVIIYFIEAEVGRGKRKGVVTMEWKIIGWMVISGGLN